MPDPVYKIVDATQLDADITTIANAIRSRSGGSSALLFPTEMVTAIENLSKVYTEAIAITPTTSAQTVQVPEGYDGVSNVTVSAIQIDSTNNTATANGTYNPSSGKYFNQFIVNIPVYDGSYSQS